MWQSSSAALPHLVNTAPSSDISFQLCESSPTYPITCCTKKFGADALSKLISLFLVLLRDPPCLCNFAKHFQLLTNLFNLQNEINFLHLIILSGFSGLSDIVTGVI